LRCCADREIAYVPFFPIGSPFAGGPKPLAEDPTISFVAAKHAATPAQIAPAWLLHNDEHVLLIPGTSSMAHLEENLAAADIALDDEDLAALDRVGALPSSR
jgi:aryl-alcohol dehydrogenase-like predicted oxidoreductase